MNWLKFIRSWGQRVSPGECSLPGVESDIRVMYQPYATKGACGLIDQGFMNGFVKNGAQVVAWDCDTDSPRLEAILERFKPTHFVGYMQRPRRDNYRWLSAPMLGQLLDYKKKRRLKVAVNSYPSNLGELFGDWLKLTQHHVAAGVSSFYNQKDRPNDAERVVLETGFIDVITSRFSSEQYDSLYKNFLPFGIRILEEPPAADSSSLGEDPDGGEATAEEIDVLYVGNCWSFKWDNMKEYVIPMKERFGNQFRIFGTGWPDGLSEGPLLPISLSSFASYSKKAAINLAFHEPSQVLDFATSGNERVFKQLFLGCFVLSDPCATFRHYFQAGKHLVVTRSGSEMVEQAEHYLAHPTERAEIAQSGQAHVTSEHTYERRVQRLFAVLANGEPGINNYV